MATCQGCVWSPEMVRNGGEERHERRGENYPSLRVRGGWEKEITEGRGDSRIAPPPPPPPPLPPPIVCFSPPTFRVLTLHRFLSPLFPHTISSVHLHGESQGCVCVICASWVFIKFVSRCWSPPEDQLLHSYSPVQYFIVSLVIHKPLQPNP